MLHDAGGAAPGGDSQSSRCQGRSVRGGRARSVAEVTEGSHAPRGHGVNRPSPAVVLFDSLWGEAMTPDREEAMKPILTEAMRDAVVRALVLLGRVSEAAGGTGQR